MRNLLISILLMVLLAVPCLAGSVSLAWDSKATDVNCTGINIYRSVNADLSGAIKVRSAGKNDVTWTDTTAIGPRTYYYYATATYDAPNGTVAESVKSNVVTAIVPAPVMIPPANVRVTTTGP